ncbi:histidine kinase OS=Streptomyces violarus OX=67380 GN=FHS41_002211 PE=4 SV=1 [Streptomyces violarus]
MAVRLPRPRRFDVYVALGGLLGGLLLWGVGLATRPHTEAYVFLPGRWPVLLPLLVMAGCELLRRTAPRVALLTGTAALSWTPSPRATWSPS